MRPVLQYTDRAHPGTDRASTFKLLSLKLTIPVTVHAGFCCDGAPLYDAAFVAKRFSLV
jgi:hypothetical protein